ncbi:MAG: hypothetical protein RR058_00890 [Oscillospiraceae bacterium]
MIGPDRCQISKLISSEMSFYNSVWAQTLLGGTTIALGLFTTAFSYFFSIRSTTEAHDKVLFVSAAALLCLIAVLSFFYKRAKAANGMTYPLVTGYACICYAMCSAESFVLLKAAWMWQFESSIPRAFMPQYAAAFLQSLFVLLVSAIFYGAVIFVKAKLPYPAVGKLYAVNCLLPLLSLFSIATVSMQGSSETQATLAYWLTFVYFSLMSYLFVRFLAKTLYYVLSTRQTTQKSKVYDEVEAKSESSESSAPQEAVDGVDISEISILEPAKEPEDDSSSAKSEGGAASAPDDEPANEPAKEHGDGSSSANSEGGAASAPDDEKTVAQERKSSKKSSVAKAKTAQQIISDAQKAEAKKRGASDAQKAAATKPKASSGKPRTSPAKKSKSPSSKPSAKPQKKHEVDGGTSGSSKSNDNI